MIYILKNYDFLEPLVKEGQINKNAFFFQNGLCVADDKKNPNTVFVFNVESGVIHAIYGWTKKKNKKFYKFYYEVLKILLKFNVPIVRMGANEDFKNHTKLYKKINDIKIYEFKRELKYG